MLSVPFAYVAGELLEEVIGAEVLNFFLINKNM